MDKGLFRVLWVLLFVLSVFVLGFVTGYYAFVSELNGCVSHYSFLVDFVRSNCVCGGVLP